MSADLRERLQAHCERLCREHQISWWPAERGRKADSLRLFSEIHTPPIRGPVSYATVLHEIGHVLGRYQDSRRVMVVEAAAWRWARAHALIWTPGMERHRVSAMAWYARRAARIDRERAKWPTVAEQLEAAARGKVIPGLPPHP